MSAKSKHNATVTNEANTAKMETMAVETSLEEPPAVPPKNKDTISFRF